MSTQKTLIILSLSSLMLIFQNCGPAFKPETSMEQTNSINTDALRASYKGDYYWSLDSIVKKGEFVKKPDSSILQFDLNLDESHPDPDLLCAGSCPSKFNINVISNCHQASGLIIKGFSEAQAFNQINVTLNKTLLTTNCSTEDWENWLINLISTASNFEYSKINQLENLKFINRDFVIKFKRNYVGFGVSL